MAAVAHNLSEASSLVASNSSAGTISGNANVSLSHPLNSTLHAASHKEAAAAGAAIAIFYCVLAVMVSCQYALLWWKKQHKRSYEGVTLVGLWAFPPVISFHLRFWRFCVVWAVWSTMSAWLLSLCLNKRRLDRTTPSRVYTWFLSSHKVSVAAGVAGYLLLLVELFGGGPMLALVMPPGVSLMVLWYGLYFGVLGRDVAEVASDQMAAVMGSGRQLAVSLKDCGICGSELKDHMSHLDATAFPTNFAAVENDGGGARQPGVIAKDPTASVQLACHHLFHPLCIRGWTLVGKKSVCPVCLEKVDLKDLFAERPWETRNLSWVQMLDALRYVIVWNPLLLFLLHLALGALGIVPHPHSSSLGNLAAASNSTVVDANAVPALNTSALVNATIEARKQLTGNL